MPLQWEDRVALEQQRGRQCGHDRPAHPLAGSRTLFDFAETRQRVDQEGGPFFQKSGGLVEAWPNPPGSTLKYQ